MFKRLMNRRNDNVPSPRNQYKDMLKRAKQRLETAYDVLNRTNKQCMVEYAICEISAAEREIGTIITLSKEEL